MNVYAETLRELKAAGNLRTIPEGREPGAEPSGLVDFSTNDYLGIGADESLRREFVAQPEFASLGFSASASRLLASQQREHRLLEQLLEELYGRRTLLFNSGYHANTGMLQALASVPSTLIVADRLAHASAIDGMILSRAPFERFPHNDHDRLERLLARREEQYDRVIVVVESVYSMDGDRADIHRLAEIKHHHPKVMLYVDEAHAFGVLGDRGLGLCRSADAADYAAVDVVIGTLGKAAASVGAFAVLGDTLYDFAVNRVRSLIFSTALPPVNCAWSRFVIERMTGMDDRRRHLAALSSRLASRLGRDDDDRYIVPFIVGNAEAAVAMSQQLLALGLKVLPIRTPTVPPGTERLRISLSAAMNTEDVDRLADALISLSHEPEPDK